MSDFSAAAEQIGALRPWSPPDANALHEELTDLPLLVDAVGDVLASVGAHLEETGLPSSYADACFDAAGQLAAIADALAEGPGQGVMKTHGTRAQAPAWVREMRPAAPPPRPDWVDGPPLRPQRADQIPREPQMRTARPRPPEDPPEPPPSAVREPRRPSPRGPGSGAARIPDGPLARWRWAMAA